MENTKKKDSASKDGNSSRKKRTSRHHKPSVPGYSSRSLTATLQWQRLLVNRRAGGLSPAAPLCGVESAAGERVNVLGSSLVERRCVWLEKVNGGARLEEIEYIPTTSLGRASVSAAACEVGKRRMNRASRKQTPRTPSNRSGVRGVCFRCWLWCCTRLRQGRHPSLCDSVSDATRCCVNVHTLGRAHHTGHGRASKWVAQSMAR